MIHVRRMLMLAAGLIAACGVQGDASNCSEVTCDGCCTSSGNCVKGNSDSNCGSKGLACDTCPYPNQCVSKSGTYSCTRCGDNTCNGSETCASCPSDCGNCCGNGACRSSEGETCSTCPQDCGACMFCGDGKCMGSETCSSCSTDCGVCRAPYSACTSSTQCSSGYTCFDYVGGTANRCRRTCTASSQCSGVSGASNTPYCDTGNNACNLQCASATASCPLGAACQKFTNNTYGYCD